MNVLANTAWINRGEGNMCIREGVYAREMKRILWKKFFVFSQRGKENNDK